MCFKELDMMQTESTACVGVECVQEAARQTLTVMASPWFVAPVLLVSVVVVVGLAIFPWLMKVSSNAHNNTEE